MTVNILGSWGARPESVEQLAYRWREFLDQLQTIDTESLTGWTYGDEGRTLDAGLRPLVDLLSVPTPGFDHDRLGRTLVLESSRPSCPLARADVTAGGSGGVVGSRALLTLDVGQVPEPGELPAAARARSHFTDLLTTLVEAWQPDHASVSDRATRDALATAQGLRNSSPRCGVLTYLSAGRRALLPDMTSLPVAVTPTVDGGVLLDATRADARMLLSLDGTLRAAGALENLPMGRARW